MKTFRQIINEQDDSVMAPAEEPMESPDPETSEERSAEEQIEIEPDPEVPEETATEPEVPSEVYFGRHTISHTESINGHSIPFASVRSSHIDEIGYDPTEQTLYIKCSGGALYAYSDVDDEEWRGLVDAGEMGDSPSESKGKYVAMYIKGPNPRTSPLKAYERIS